MDEIHQLNTENKKNIQKYEELKGTLVALFESNAASEGKGSNAEMQDKLTKMQKKLEMTEKLIGKNSFKNIRQKNKSQF